MNLILASGSKARATILRRAGFEFTKHPADIDETEHKNESARELVIRLAIEKAKAISEHYPDSLIIGSDQVAEFDGGILGKPHGFDKGMEHLMSFSGQSVEFINGLCLLNTGTGDYQTKLNIITTTFRAYSVEMAENYLKAYEPYECAGSLKVEGPGIRLIESIDSKDPNALEGLCVIDLITMLENENYPIGKF